uniref:Uncharacterized protein n=1 Tax=Micrurus spixii TaxID=129469 RepID=A0A2D4M3Z1_9SAUR
MKIDMESLQETPFLSMEFQTKSHPGIRFCIWDQKKIASREATFSDPETWWDEIHDWNILIERYKLFKKKPHSIKEEMELHYISTEMHGIKDKNLLEKRMTFRRYILQATQPNRKNRCTFCQPTNKYM